ncbi:MAG: Tm-1-like ATP-binding domain-containing protein [Planctomycetia bacterium]|nr:Tm-1-like ATP-binding domain-containing protein [Planctomycetia bacterium]
MSVFLLATLDTKGHEAAFVRDELARRGVKTTLVDAGCLGRPAVAADVPRETLFAAAGTSLEDEQRRGDRGRAVAAAAQGAAQIVAEAYARGEVQGVLAIGGSAGTTIGASAMRALPLGVPKLMVSTLASGQVRQYVGDKDILMLNSVVDISGINRISRLVLGNAAAAMAGMVAARPAGPATKDKPLVTATMFGVTTKCVERARQVLEQAGYEVLVFHATGSGGQAMESLIADGLIAGVLDITTTELADELVGGVLSAGPDRLTAAAKAGVPQVVSVGALDMVNFHAPETVPERFRHRLFYRHNPTVTLMRTTAEENARLGEEIGRKVSASRGPAAILLPGRGVSAIDAAGQPFDDAAAREALFDGIRRAAVKVEVVEHDLHINDPQFAEAAAKKLLALMQKKS